MAADERCARLADKAGVVIDHVTGIPRSVSFASWGQPPHIYLPAGWSGPMADDAICGRFSDLLSGLRTDAERGATWRDHVARMCGPPLPALVGCEAAS